jgi:hypothetical protein
MLQVCNKAVKVNANNASSNVISHYINMHSAIKENMIKFNVDGTKTMAEQKKEFDRLLAESQAKTSSKPITNYFTAVPTTSTMRKEGEVRRKEGGGCVCWHLTSRLHRGCAARRGTRCRRDAPLAETRPRERHAE